MNKKLIPLAVAGFLLAGCSSAATQAGSAPSAPVTKTEASQPAVATEAVPTASGEVDKTADFKTANASAAWAGSITAVTETEPGRLSIDTTLIDPRGAADSEAAKTAIAICESAVQLYQPSNVAVKEKDGTHFVLFGHPSVPVGACAEVRTIR